MKRFAVQVLVTYHLDAEDASAAFEKIKEGAEYPVVPYDDNTYCAEDVIVDVKEI